MRLLLLILLLANAAVFGYVFYSQDRTETDKRIAALQINPDKLKLVQPSKSTVAEPRVQSAACIEWGPFGADDVARAAAIVADLGLSNNVMQRETAESYWVYLPPQKNRDDAESKAAELEALGISKYRIIPEKGEWRHAISLGDFKTEGAARDFLAKARAKGVNTAQMGPRGARNTLFVIRDPSDAVAAKLAAANADFTAVQLKAGPCG